MEQEELLKEIAEILKDLGIPYLITGGIAVVVWGRPRFTADIDVVVHLLPQKLDALAAELLRIDKDAYVDKAMMQRAHEQRGEFNFIHPASGLKVDFWIMKGDPFSQAVMKRRRRKRIAGTTIFLSSPEDLILNKLLWYRMTESTRQLEDIESVMRIQKKLDWKYLRKWATIHKTLGVLSALDKKKS